MLLVAKRRSRFLQQRRLRIPAPALAATWRWPRTRRGSTTRLQVAYQDLRQTQQTVMQQERLRALGQIASGIAHDINNALSPAALYTQSLLLARAGAQRAFARAARRDPARHRGRGADRAAHARVLHAARPRAHARAGRPEPDPRAGHRPHARALEQHAAGARRRGAASRRDLAPDLPQDPGRRERGARRADQPHAQRRRRAARRRRDHAAHALRRARRRRSSSRCRTTASA